MNSKLILFIFLTFYSASSISSELCTELNQCLSRIIKTVEESIDFESKKFEPWRTNHVAFSLSNNFAIESVKIIESSGSDDFDSVVLEGVSELKAFYFLSGLEIQDQEKLTSFVLKITTPKKGNNET